MISPRLTSETPIIVQGITGRQGRLHAGLMRGYGGNVVGGTSPSGKHAEVDGMPVYLDCAEAVRATGAEATLTMVRPGQVLEAVAEALDAGIRVICSPTEGVPVHDSLKAARLVRDAGALWIGPSTPGMAVPGQAKLGFLPEVSLAPGPLGLMSKSGTLSYEVGYRLVRAGLGQSVWVGVGGDPVKGVRFGELVPFYKADDRTGGLVVIGEIGGTEEEDFAAALREHGFDKPVFVLVAGATAPEGVTMGHAGALAHGAHGTFAAKKAALERAGARVFAHIGDLIDAVADEFEGRAA
ncbi:MAG: succinate--CoA ligase subunit alpha [Acetobacterales bacterium]